MLAGIAIAVIGFLTQHLTEAPGQTTILNNYALMAFLTSGFAGGFAYWLVSGRLVAGLPGNPPRETTTVSATPFPRRRPTRRKSSQFHARALHDA